jgi:hypothetical protein
MTDGGAGGRAHGVKRDLILVDTFSAGLLNGFPIMLFVF